ncbi:MAG: nuclear transport factor 2 family protein [Planctomycetes bacterium]|nr:nuclear transport factor 2 family protein [Planctomycetota bacterium]
MTKPYIKLLCLIAILIAATIVIANAPDKTDTAKITDRIIAIETEALKSWNNGDPSGYLKIYAEEITYFDVGTNARLDGYSAMEKLFDPARGKIYGSRFKMLNPKVQLHGSVAVLTFNLVTYSDKDKVISPWNATEVYAKINNQWKIIHSHWSKTKDIPQLNPKPQKSKTKDSS